MLKHKATLTRRELLARAGGATALVAIGSGFIAAPDAAWALEVVNITEHEMATLIQMARDIYPHDRIGDQFYAVAVKGYDSEGTRDMVAQGIAMLDEKARAAGHGDYKTTPWEENRVALLREIEDEPFFQTVRGGLVTGLYNQKDVWPIFGYEGESFSQGGYIDRGFDDIAWL
ncbi:Twin-arginine translocation pathway signal [Roseovarius sp. SCSIO 43702]|uniref:Twin-arginine translocation pathway signal n=1 Tax=Roseovarius sp. SCSIO 43702 TaxID=2823043 RepID=UPI001C736E0E|nr:Twin-arginine translocation pathway signal [Roseovarius sp. SCSIO 43702]QYX57169.1 Twin-arginine translocation pathway signal [Roseovarius sp. SCSIO 43702]